MAQLSLKEWGASLPGKAPEDDGLHEEEEKASREEPLTVVMMLEGRDPVCQHFLQGKVEEIAATLKGCAKVVVVTEPRFNDAQVVSLAHRFRLGDVMAFPSTLFFSTEDRRCLLVERPGFENSYSITGPLHTDVVVDLARYASDLIRHAVDEESRHPTIYCDA